MDLLREGEGEMVVLRTGTKVRLLRMVNLCRIHCRLFPVLHMRRGWWEGDVGL